MSNLLLLVDDDPGVLAALLRVLQDEPYEIYTAQSGEDALALMNNLSFKVVVSDERMPGLSGADFLTIVREKFPETVRIMLTGHAGLAATMKAVNEGEIYRFFAKPWDNADLLLAIRTAVEKFDLEAENHRLRRIIKNQAAELNVMEKKYPGITRIDKDGSGTILLPEVSDDEMAEILAECEKE